MYTQEGIYLSKRQDLYTRGRLSFMLGALGYQMYAFVVFVGFYSDILIYNVRCCCFRWDLL